MSNMAKDAGAPITKFGRQFGALTMFDFATMQGMKGNEEKSLHDLLNWMYTPKGALAAIAISGAKNDPLFTEQQAGELANAVELLELAGEIVGHSLPTPSDKGSSAEGND